MAKVVNSELTGGGISRMVSLLDAEATSTDALNKAISSFMYDSSSTLVGKSYDAARSKMNLYLQDVGTRSTLAAELASAISSGAESLSGYMEGYDMLDDSEIPEMESTISSLKQKISSAQATIRSIKQKDPKANVSSYTSNISYCQSYLAELEKKLEKLKGLGAADSAAFSEAMALADSVAKFSASVEGIQVSSITLE